ncbi:hypothetical protein [Streptomyces sp. NPDC017260]
MRDRAALCLAVGTFGLTAMAGAVLIFLVARRHCLCCMARVEEDYLAAE